MTRDRSKRQQKCVGVNAGVENSYTSLSDSESCSGQCGRSVNNVKNELKTVIELMGPTTPHFNMSSSNNADNDSSFLYTTTTTATPLDKTKSEDDPLLTECDCSTLPPDVIVEKVDEDFSMMVDKPSTIVDIQENEAIQCICPPPNLPANFVFNSECMCPQIASYIHNGHNGQSGGQTIMEKTGKQGNLIQSLFRNFKEKRNGTLSKRCEYYKMNIKQSQTNMGNPRRLIFDLVDDIPKPNDFKCRCQISDEIVDEKIRIYEDESYCKKKKNLKNELLSAKQELDKDEMFCIDEKIDPKLMQSKKDVHRKTTYTDSNGTTRVDVYYFDHGNSSYLRTTDRPPVVITEAIAEKTEAHTTKFWAELFGSFHIGFAFFTTFILQSTRFLLYSVIRPLTVGMIQLVSDYFFKPLLATVFNACIQPPLIFIYNIASSLRDCCDPVAEGMGYFLREIAFLIRSFRVVEVKNERYSEIPYNCEREK